jgi:hypothetical protein
MSTSVFQVIVSNYSDMTEVENTEFISLDKEKAIEAAQRLYKENLSNDEARPELIRYSKIIKDTRNTFNGNLIAVFESPLDKPLNRKNQTVVWSADEAFLKSFILQEIRDVFMYDLNLSLEDYMAERIYNLFKKNPESFRKNGMYGITIHSGDILTMVDIH